MKIIFLFLFFVLFVNSVSASIVTEGVDPNSAQHSYPGYTYINFEKSIDPWGWEANLGEPDYPYLSGAGNDIIPYYFNNSLNGVWFQNDTASGNDVVWFDCTVPTYTCSSPWISGYTINGTWGLRLDNTFPPANRLKMKFLSGSSNVSFIISSTGTTGTAYDFNGSIADTFSTISNFDTGTVSRVELHGKNISTVFINGTINQFLVDDLQFKNTTSFISIDFDPSGYVKDGSGSVIGNAKVTISNNTYSTFSYSDISGYWNVDIFQNGTYNYTVSRLGYTILSGSQAFVIGGTNYNFTLTGGSGEISGFIYESINSSGSTPILGDIKSIEDQWSSTPVLGIGSTLTYGVMIDGRNWVLKLEDIDQNGGNYALISLLADGHYAFQNQLINKNQIYKFSTGENDVLKQYILIQPTEIFLGREIGRINLKTSVKYERKIFESILKYLIFLASNPILSIHIFNIDNFYQFSVDGTNLNPVEFNSTRTVIGSLDFDFGSESTINNFYVVINAESTTQNSAKMEIGYTDDDIDASSFLETIYINNKQLYRTQTESLNFVDANGNKKVRVWFKVDGGYSNLKLYEIYVNGFGTDNLKPLKDATIYFDETHNTLSDTLGFYKLSVPLGTNKIKYYKSGYESKNITHIFNSSYPSWSQTVILNSTSKFNNQTSEYIYVDPNTIISGTPGKAYYRTLDKINPIIFGGYQIAVCPYLENSDCDSYDVPANTENSVPLKDYPIGEYKIMLTGYEGGIIDFFRDVIVSNNFTVISNSPSIAWSSNIYYLDETMRLKVYVPGNPQIVVVKAPNGTQIYSNIFSQSTLIYNVSFVTSSNFTLNNYPPGTYSASINGSINKASTELKNISANEYKLDVPSSINYGDVLIINYQSPRTSILYAKTKNNNVFISEEVNNKGSKNFNTSKLTASENNLTIQLIRNNVIVAEKFVSVGYTTNKMSADPMSDVWGSTWLWGGLLIIIFAVTGAKSAGVPGFIGGYTLGFITSWLAKLIPTWSLFIGVISIIIMLAFIIAHKQTNVGSD